MNAAFSALVAIGQKPSIGELQERFVASTEPHGSLARLKSVLEKTGCCVEPFRFDDGCLPPLEPGTILHFGSIRNGHYATVLCDHGHCLDFADQMIVFKGIDRRFVIDACSGYGVRVVVGNENDIEAIIDAVTIFLACSVMLVAAFLLADLLKRAE